MRCTGHCCRCFTLTHSPEWIRREIESVKDSRRVTDVFWREDAQKVLDMIIPLGRLSLEERNEIAAVVDGLEMPTEPAECYTCRHFDGTNCTNYENRPNLCRSYPDSGRCEYAGCTAECSLRSYRPDATADIPAEVRSNEADSQADYG